MKIEFELDKIVLHSQSVRYMVRGEKAMSYTTKEYNDFKALIKSKVNTPQMYEPSQGTFKMQVIYPIRGVDISKRKTGDVIKDEKVFNSPKLTKPDIDNVAKSILDALSGVLYEDDQLLHDLHLVKKYSDNIEDKKIKIVISWGEL
jgi:Holliday junction resolvase RusA-like endonuclease